MSVATAAPDPEAALAAAIRQRDSARNRAELDEGKAAIARAKQAFWASRAASGAAATADLRDERAAREAHAAARPERWAALTLLEQGCYHVAANPPPSGIRSAFLQLAFLLGNPSVLRTVPETFERSEK